MATSGRYNVDTEAFGSSLGSNPVGGKSALSGVGVSVTVGVKGLGVGVKGSGVDVSVAIGVKGLGVGVFVGAARVQSEEMLLASIVTAPFCAKALPKRLALVFRVILVRARMLPTNAVPVPRVAELPICQKTLQSEAPLIKSTVALLAVVIVLPVWKIKTAAGSPPPSSVSAPVNCADVLGKQ